MYTNYKCTPKQADDKKVYGNIPLPKNKLRAEIVDSLCNYKFVRISKLMIVKEIELLSWLEA